MKLLIGLILMGLLGACSLSPVQTLTQVEPYVPPVQPTNMPSPDLYAGGFSYYEDANLPAGFDPVFVVCGGKAVKLLQTGEGWNVEHISVEALRAYPSLTPAGQRSDFGFYTYDPSVGEIYFKGQLVQSFHNEYNPEYWIWAWTSLMFVKNCRLHIYYVRPDGTITKQPTVEF